MNATNLGSASLGTARAQISPPQKAQTHFDKFEFS